MGENIPRWCGPRGGRRTSLVSEHLRHPAIGQLWEANQDLDECGNGVILYPIIFSGEKVIILRAPMDTKKFEHDYRYEYYSLDFQTLDGRIYRIYYDQFHQAFEFIDDCYESRPCRT